MILFDLDGTLTEKWGDRFLPGVLDRLAALEDEFTIVTNQGGIGYRYYLTQMGRKRQAQRYPTLGDVLERLSRITRQIHEATGREGIRVYVSTHHGNWMLPRPIYGKRPKDILRQPIAHGEAAICGHMEWRKPRPGMLIQAMRDRYASWWRRRRDQVVMVGDRLEDRVAAHNAKVRFIEAEQWRKGSSECEPGKAA